MKTALILTAVTSVVALVLAAVVLAINSGVFAAQPHAGRMIHVIEHAITDTIVHIGPPKEKDSRGDVLAFANPVFDVANQKKVGSDNGHCIRTDPGKAWECFWTVFLDTGQITVEGPFFDSADSMLAITGGTGAYQGANGQMKLHARNSQGTEYDFLYMLTN